MNLLTASSAKAARACGRLYQMRYIDGWGPAHEAAVLRFGTLVHHGLEAWWRAAMAGTGRLAAALAAMEGESDPYELAKARALLIGYDARWGDLAMEVLAVEVEFRAPLVNPETGAPSRTFEMGGKIDAVVRVDGRVLLVEHKTSSEDVRPGSDYWRRLRIDGQISHYFAGARALGFDVEGCLYDVVSKPGIRPLKATPVEARKYTKDGRLYAAQRTEDETPEAYFARVGGDIAADPSGYFQLGEVARIGADLDEHAADLWLTADLMRGIHRSGRAARNPDACVRYGRTCDFFDVCTGAASLDDATRFVRKAPHSELSDAGTQGAKEEPTP